MRHVLICAGVLGGGSALTFAIAAVAASLAPPGPLLYGATWNGSFIGNGMVRVEPAPVWLEKPMPLPAPVDVDTDSRLGG